MPAVSPTFLNNSLSVSAQLLSAYDVPSGNSGRLPCLLPPALGAGVCGRLTTSSSAPFSAWWFTLNCTHEPDVALRESDPDVPPPFKLIVITLSMLDEFWLFPMPNWSAECTDGE